VAWDAGSSYRTLSRATSSTGEVLMAAPYCASKAVADLERQTTGSQVNFTETVMGAAAPRVQTQ
jgi:hypothetical protein